MKRSAPRKRLDFSPCSEPKHAKKLAEKECGSPQGAKDAGAGGGNLDCFSSCLTGCGSAAKCNVCLGLKQVQGKDVIVLDLETSPRHQSAAVPGLATKVATEDEIDKMLTELKNPKFN